MALSPTFSLSSPARAKQLLHGQSAKHPAPEFFGDRLHFRGNRSVIIVEIGMVSAGVGYTEAVSRTAEIKAELLDLRRLGIGKVDEREPADRAGSLTISPDGFPKYTFSAYCAISAITGAVITASL